MRKALMFLAVAAFIVCPVMSWAAAISDDVTRDTTPGDPFELTVTLPAGNTNAYTVIDPIGTQEIFYAVRGADGRYYYTFRDLCPDNSAACAAGEEMRHLGRLECQEGFDVFSPVQGGNLCANGPPFAGITFGPLTGTPNADFGGEFFAATNIAGEVGAWAGLTAFGPGLNGDIVMSSTANNGMGDANVDGWPGGAGDTPWVLIPTGASGDSDPTISYETAPYQYQWAAQFNGLTAQAFFTDPRRNTQIISNFDILIDVRGNDGVIYRTAYNLNSVNFPMSAIPTPPIPGLDAGTGAALAYVDGDFPVDTGAGGAVNGDGWPRIATRINPNTGTIVVGSFAEESPWIAVSN